MEYLLEKNLNLKTLALIVLTYSLWGGNTVAIKYAVGSVPPFLLAALRIGLTIGVFLLWNISLSIPFRSKGRELSLLILNGALFASNNALFMIGINVTYAARATILVNTYPFFVALLAHFFQPGDRLTWPKVAGLFLAFIGVTIIFIERAGGQERMFLGDLLILISSVILGVRVIVVKKLVGAVPPSKILFWSTIISVPLFLLGSGLSEDITTARFPLLVVVAILYMGFVVSGFCFFAQTALIKTHNPSLIAAFAFLTPIAGVILAGLFLGEPITTSVTAGTFLVALGLFLISYWARIPTKVGAIETS